MISRWISVVALAAAVAGCVTVPEQQHALLLEADGTVVRRAMICPQPTVDARARDGALDGRVRIASWNLHKEADPGWRTELAALTEKSDVMLLQEAGVAFELRETIERAGFRWVLASSFEYLKAEYGVLTASRIAPTGACTLRAFEPLLGIPKSALITYLPLLGREATLAVANLHSINFAPGTGRYRAQLEAIGDALATHAGPVVVAGDFNIWNDARAREVQGLADRLSLSPVAFPDDSRRRFMGRIFDWIYVRGLDVESAAAWDVSSSDHNPLLVTLRIR